MKHLHRFISLGAILLFAIYTLSAKDFMKYGKISDEEINMTVCAFDSNASAVVLGDIGRSVFEISEEDIEIVLTRHVRIKVFDKESFDKGNFTISLYRSSKTGAEEDLRSIKGSVYNMVEGKLERTKLSSNNIFRENVNKNRNIVKVTMPDVREGSIIDLTYTVSSPFLFNLDPWYFQSDIPTLKSVYELGIIEWYNYKSWIEGYLIVDMEEIKIGEKFSYLKSSKITPGIGGGRTSGGNVEFNATVSYQTYSAENVPAFKNEPYTTMPYDYYSSVHFELRSTRYPWSAYKSYTQSWKDINRLLLEDEDFGYTIKFDGHLKELADKINSQTTDPIQKAKLAYENILADMVWDGRYRVYVDNSIRKAYNDKTGSSADINLNLVALCRLLDLETYPVIISTRNHGKLRPASVNLTQFNHVIAAVKINDKYLLMDAIDKYCPYNLLPPQSLNGQGRLVDESEGEWIDLYSSKYKKEFYLANLAFTDNMELKGNLTFKSTDYSALRFRKDYKSEESNEDYVVELEEELDGIEIESFDVKNLDSLDKSIVVNTTIKASEGINSINDMVFFNPKIIGQKEENAFKLDERVYPIDYNFPIREQYTITIKIPEGYVVDEVPAPLVIALSNNKGKYLYQAKPVGNYIQFICQYIINQTVFPSVDYPELKKFHELIVSKEAEQIVLKKAN